MARLFREKLGFRVQGWKAGFDRHVFLYPHLNFSELLMQSTTLIPYLFGPTDAIYVERVLTVSVSWTMGTIFELALLPFERWDSVSPMLAPTPLSPFLNYLWHRLTYLYLYRLASYLIVPFESMLLPSGTLRERLVLPLFASSLFVHLKIMTIILAVVVCLMISDDPSNIVYSLLCSVKYNVYYFAISLVSLFLLCSMTNASYTTMNILVNSHNNELVVTFWSVH